MDILLHSNEPSRFGRVVLENYVAAFLGEGGKVRACSFKTEGWTMDVEVFGDRAEAKLKEFTAFLRRMEVPSDTALCYVLSDGSSHTIMVYEGHA